MIWVLTLYCAIGVGPAVGGADWSPIAKQYCGIDDFEYLSEAGCVSWAEIRAQTLFDKAGIRAEYSCREQPRKKSIYIPPRRP